MKKNDQKNVPGTHRRRRNRDAETGRRAKDSGGWKGIPGPKCDTKKPAREGQAIEK